MQKIKPRFIRTLIKVAIQSLLNKHQDPRQQPTQPTKAAQLHNSISIFTNGTIMKNTYNQSN